MKYIIQYLQKAAYLKIQDLEKNHQLSYDLKDTVQIDHIGLNNLSSLVGIYEMTFISRYPNRKSWCGFLAFSVNDPLLKGILNRICQRILKDPLFICLAIHLNNHEHSLVVSSNKDLENAIIKYTLLGRVL